MIKNFFTIAFRNLLKRKVYSFINIFGLAIGVAVCLIILQYVDFELSYDKFHQHGDNIYRVTATGYQGKEKRGTGALSGYALAPAMMNDIPEVKYGIRTHPMYGGAVVTYKRDNGDASVFREDGIQMVDSTFLDVFTYKSLQGDLNTALDKPNSIVITKKIAEKYFKKDEEPVGKILNLSGGWIDGDYEVTAILENTPQNSHFGFDVLLPVHNLLRNGQYTHDDGWGWNNFITYVQLHDNATAANVEAKLPAFVDKYRGKELAESGRRLEFNLQPIKQVHITPGYDNEMAPTISTQTIYFFLVIAIFILSIAWINYINLSTARAMERAREVGIKKAIGAFRSQLMGQFILESILVNFFGVLIASVIAIGLLPVLGEIVGKELVFNFADIRLWGVLIGLFLFGSLVSGAYPAFVLSSFQTIEVLKGKSEKATGGFSLRKALVVFQFASSLILIAGTFTIYRQLMHMRTQDKGLIVDQMLVFDGPSIMDQQGAAARDRLITVKNILKDIPGVESVTTSAAIPGGGYNWGTMLRKDGAQVEDNKRGSIVWVDPDFVPTYGIEVVAGRNFNPEIKSDMESILINEACLTAFNLGDAEHALQERLLMGGDTVAILGVLKNYNWASLKEDLSPWMMKADTVSRRNYSLHLKTSDVKGTISKIEKEYKEAFPGNPFNFFFLDEFFDRQYRDDQQFGKLFTMFAILAIVIACLGLWGLASFTTAQKLKEIGIRKVLGASVSSIMSLLSWQFFKLVLIASVIAIPLTWWGISTWLDNFAFRIGLEWDLFVVPVVILSLIALGTVSLQILRGARINPAKILRTE